MWVLVVILQFQGNTAMIPNHYIYSTKESCQYEADLAWQTYMATRPDADAKAHVFCAEVPQGI